MVSASKVIDEVSGWLRLYDDGSIDRTWSGPSEVKSLASPVPPSAPTFADGVATRDLIIHDASSLSVRIYVPEKQLQQQHEKLSLLLHFHGGGFCVSRADWYMYYQFYTRLVASAPAICVSVEMRLAPEHKLPAAVHDCHAALLWLRAVARGETPEPWLDLGGRADLERVFLVGDSSGANLAHEVAVQAGAEELSPLKLAGAMLLHPGFVRVERSRSEAELPSDTAFLTLEMIDKFLAMALPAGSTKEHPITCPMGPAAPQLEGLRLPPVLVAVAEGDLMRDTQLEYVEAMKNAGKDVELVVSPGMKHCFYLNRNAVDSDPETASQTDALVAIMVRFINTHS